MSLETKYLRELLNAAVKAELVSSLCKFSDKALAPLTNLFDDIICEEIARDREDSAAEARLADPLLQAVHKVITTWKELRKKERRNLPDALMHAIADMEESLKERLEGEVLAEHIIDTVLAAGPQKPINTEPSAN